MTTFDRLPLRGALSGASFDLARAYRLAKFHLAQRGAHAAPVLVYQMGKVGSSTIVASLREHAPQRRVFHVHYLTAAGLEGRESFYRERYADLHRIPQHLIEGRYIRRALLKGSPHRWEVVTLVRDPVACNVSRFFQTLGAYHPDVRVSAWDEDGWVEELVDRFLTCHDHDVVLNWFEQELGQALGIDVYASPFEHGRACATYAGPAADLLLLRLEDLDEVGGRALSEFLDVRLPTLSVTNVAEGKSYAPAYQAFCREIGRQGEYLDLMYDSKLARHFYGLSERAALRRRWSERSRSPA